MITNEPVVFDEMINKLTEMKQVSIQLKNMQDEMQSIKSQVNKVSEQQEDNTNKINKLDDLTNVIEWDKSLMKELAKTVKSRCFKFTGSEHTPEYKLLYGTYSRACNNHIRNIFNVNSVTKINVSDFNTALTAAKNWTPTQKLEDKRIKTLVKLQESNQLSESISKALDIYLNNN